MGGVTQKQVNQTNDWLSNLSNDKKRKLAGEMKSDGKTGLLDWYIKKYGAKKSKSDWLGQAVAQAKLKKAKRKKPFEGMAKLIQKARGVNKEKG